MPEEIRTADPMLTLAESILKLGGAIHELQETQERSERQALGRIEDKIERIDDRLCDIEDKIDKLIAGLDPNLSPAGETALARIRKSEATATAQGTAADAEIAKLSKVV